MDIEQSLKLRHVEKVDRLSKEESEEHAKIIAEMNERGILQSGATIRRVYKLHLEYAEKKVLALIDSVKELIDLRAIEPSPEWKARLSPGIEAWLSGIEHSLRSRRDLKDFKDYADRQIQIDISGLRARIRRRFELMFFDESQRAKMNRMGPISIGTLNVTGIANIGEIVGDINQSINQVQSAGESKIAEILKEIGQAALSDPRLETQARQEIMENLHTLAQEAGQAPDKRKLGAVKAALAYLPSVVSASTDLLNYFQVHADDIRRFFGL